MQVFITNMSSAHAKKDLAKRGHEAIENIPDIPHRDPDVLYQMHHQEDLSPPQIADRLDVDPVTIRNWLHQYDLYRDPEKYHPKFHTDDTDD